MRVSRLKLVAGANATFYRLKQYVNGVSQNAQFIGLMNLTFDCNGGAQTTGEGIYLAQTPAFGQATGDDFTDPCHFVQNVMIHRAKTNCFTGQNGRSETRLVNVHAFYCGGYGFNPSPDSSLVYCNVGANGAQGFYINKSSIRLEGCKAFYCGDSAFGTETLGIGFHLDGARGVHITNSESQDCKAEGLVIEGYAWNNSVDMILDSNSKRGKGLHAAFRMGPGYWNKVRAIAYERNDPADGIFAQQNALSFSSGSDSFDNDIDMTHGRGSGPVTLGPPIMPASNTVWNLSRNRVCFNGEGSTRMLDFAATITPEPYTATHHVLTLTGNVTIAATTAQHFGQKLEFRFKQDGTGGRAVTFNAQYKVAWTPNTTANRYNTISFTYDGTNWVQAASVVGMA